ncbi:MAG: Yip1 family protein [Candidatus Methanoperedens sp.]|nr:Yip1 family protein [Candidatus Methanoperedens sp.]
MNFIEKVVETIKNPKNAMKNIAEQPMIEEAVIIVGVLAILSALAAYVRSYTLIINVENMPPSMQSVISVTGVIFALIGPFLIWLIGTGILHFISMILSGEGKFYPQMMTVVGYSMVPLLFSGLISIILLLMIEPTTITVSATNPTAVKEIYNNPYIIGSNIIGTIMQVWASVILFFGVQSAHRLTPVKSAVVAGIPLAINIISLVWSLWSIGII